MADGRAHSFAVSHNTKRRKSEKVLANAERPRVVEEERGLQFMVNYIKSKPRNKFVFKFYLCKSARRVPQLPAAHGTLVRLMSSGRHAVTQFCDRSVRMYLYWDHGQGAQSAKFRELRPIRRRRWAAKARRGPSLDSDVIADLWCIYRRGFDFHSFSMLTLEPL